MEKATSNCIIDFKGNGIYVETITFDQSKPTLVFLHDSLGCAALWRDFPKKIADATGCNMLVYDRLGYGKSASLPSSERQVDYLEQEADFLHDLLIILKLDNVILFGHSDGGSIALISASKYPSIVKGIICEAAHVFVEEITVKGILEARQSYRDTDLSQRLQKYHGDKVATLFKAWTDTWTSSSFRNWNIEHFLKNITAPLLFIQGEDDEYGSLKQVEKTVGQVSGKSQKVIMSEIGHTPHKEDPETTSTAVIKFVLNLLNPSLK